MSQLDRLSASEYGCKICPDENKLLLSLIFDYFPDFEVDIDSPIEGFGNGMSDLLRFSPVIIKSFDYVKSMFKQRFTENKENLIKNRWLGNLQKDSLEIMVELRGKDMIGLSAGSGSFNASHISFSEGLTAELECEEFLIDDGCIGGFLYVRNFDIGKQVTLIPDLKDTVDFDVVIHIKRTE